MKEEDECRWEEQSNLLELPLRASKKIDPSIFYCLPPSFISPLDGHNEEPVRSSLPEFLPKFSFKILHSVFDFLPGSKQLKCPLHWLLTPENEKAESYMPNFLLATERRELSREISLSALHLRSEEDEKSPRSVRNRLYTRHTPEKNSTLAEGAMGLKFLRLSGCRWKIWSLSNALLLVSLSRPTSS